MPPPFSLSLPHASNGHYDDNDNEYLQKLLESARPFLSRQLQLVDPKLPTLMELLGSAGAGECWHKLGSFLDHLVAIYRILKLWRSPDAVCLCALFHSAYSNSLADLAVFEPNADREFLQSYVGGPAERLIHTFFTVNRRPLVLEYLPQNYADDSELLDHLRASDVSLKAAKEKHVFDSEDSWRKKVNSVVPPEGLTLKHKFTGEDIQVSRRFIAVYLTMSMADFSEQFFCFQDKLFENSNGRLEFNGNNTVATLWPGDGKPGLWMHFMSRLGLMYMLIKREEEIFMEQKRRGDVVLEREDEDIELVVPPVFEGCTRILDPQEQIEARKLYWEAVCGSENNEKGPDTDEIMGRAEELLLGCIGKNPFIGEPHVVLAQVYLGVGRFEEAEKEAERGLRLILEWGSPWDKRMPWEGWVSWARVLLMKAKERSWPDTPLGIIGLGTMRQSS